MYSAEQSKDTLFWLKWLEKYKTLRCLWDVDSKEYTNRAKRKDAYFELVVMAKKIHPQANEAFVKARINCFRTAYRKEAKKVLAARENGRGYEPTWVYYNQLNSLFLLDNNLDELFPNQSMEASDTSDSEDPFAIEEIKPTVDKKEDVCRSRVQEISIENISDAKYEISHDFDDGSLDSFEQREADFPKEIRRGKRKFPTLKSMAANFNNIKRSREEYCAPSYGNKQAQIKQEEERHYNKPSKRNQAEIHNVGKSPATDKSGAEANCTPNNYQNLEDECDIVGRRIASHFKNMKLPQRLIAERIICDVCIHGRLDQLSWESGFIASNTSRQKSRRINSLSDGQLTYEREVVIDPADYVQI